jgi:hypothetical protein
VSVRLHIRKGSPVVQFTGLPLKRPEAKTRRLKTLVVSVDRRGDLDSLMRGIGWTEIPGRARALIESTLGTEGLMLVSIPSGSEREKFAVVRESDVSVHDTEAEA